MATTQLADVYRPTSFARRATLKQLELNAFLQSGVIVNDPIITERLSGGSNVIELPQLQGVTIKEPNYSSDDPAVKSTPGKVGTKTQKARSASRNDSWSTMDLTTEMTDADPMGAVVETIGGFWATDDESRTIQSALGVLADNVANDGGDMVIDVANDIDPNVTPVADADRISGDVVVNAAQTAGDRKRGFAALAVHSVTHARLQKLGLLVNQFDAETGRLEFQTYLGYRVIMDDSLPAVAGTNRVTYTSILFGAGAIGYGTGKVKTPSEIERIAGAGNGGGETVIHSRVNTCFHIYGTEFTSASVAGESPTYAELADAANWNRVVERKRIAIAFIKTND